jgi:hypothetical protein
MGERKTLMTVMRVMAPWPKANRGGRCNEDGCGEASCQLAFLVSFLLA